MDRTLRRIVATPNNAAAYLRAQGNSLTSVMHGQQPETGVVCANALPSPEVLLDWISRLERKPHSITTAGQLMLLSEYNLMQILGIGYFEAQSLLSLVASAIMPPISLATKLEATAVLPMRIRGLDAALRGGIQSGLITELVGRAGTGKTQFCSTLCVRVALSGRGVLYMDTEGKFSVARLSEICKCEASRVGLNEAEAEQALAKVSVVRPTSAAQLLNIIEEASTLIIKNNVGLVILDSVAILARLNYNGRKDIVARQQMLSTQASRLKYLAEVFRIPVVVTNQVASNGPDKNLNTNNNFAQASIDLTENENSSSTSVLRQTESADANASQDVHPALGNTWAHCVNIRLRLSSSSNSNTTTEHSSFDDAATSNAQITHPERFVHVVKSPLSGSGSFGFCITNAGVCNAEQHGEQHDKNDIEEARTLEGGDEMELVQGDIKAISTDSEAAVQDTRAFLMSLGADQLNDILA